jgi:hypothetical protein
MVICRHHESNTHLIDTSFDALTTGKQTTKVNPLGFLKMHIAVKYNKGWKFKEN